MMNRDQLVEAFGLLGDFLQAKLPADQEVAIYLTGSAAALLRGDLQREAKDCDMLLALPQAAAGAVEASTMEVADALGFPGDWLNQQALFFADYLPAHWRAKAEPVGKFGRLTIYSLCRQDLITAKALGVFKTGDDKHRIDFDVMNPSKGEMASSIEAIKESGRRNKEEFGNCISFLEERIAENLEGEANEA